MHANVEVREVVRVTRVATVPDHLALRHCRALGDRRAVAREMSVQRMRPIVMSDDDVVIESGRRHLTIHMRRLDVDDETRADRDEGRPDRHVEIVGVALAAAMPVAGRRTVRLRDAEGRAHGVRQHVGGRLPLRIAGAGLGRVRCGWGPTAASERTTAATIKR